MLSPLSSSTYFGFPEPVQSQMNVLRVNTQILTDDFERLHVRGVQEIEESTTSSVVGNPADTVEYSPEKIQERLKRIEFIKNRSKSLRFDVALLEGNGILRGDLAAVAFPRGLLYANAAYHSGKQPILAEVNTLDVFL